MSQWFHLVFKSQAVEMTVVSVSPLWFHFASTLSLSSCGESKLQTFKRRRKSWCLTQLPPADLWYWSKSLPSQLFLFKYIFSSHRAKVILMTSISLSYYFSLPSFHSSFLPFLLLFLSFFFLFKVHLLYVLCLCETVHQHFKSILRK